MGTYEETVEKRLQLKATIAELKARHEKLVRDLEGQVAGCDRILFVAEKGFDMDLFLTAKNIVRIEWHARGGGRYRQHGVMQELVDDAVEDLRSGGKRLKRQYFGVKEYDRWDAQRSDHEYGFGPSHGSIWFSIGLTSRARATGLSEVERIAAVAWVQAVWTDPSLLG